MTSKFTLPKKGFVFWPVGTGDSTTIVVKPDELIVQIDLHQMDQCDEDDETAMPVVDELVRLLPKKNGKPYLAVFVLTHPDKDHVSGFRELLKKVQIGEIWHTPRIFREYKSEFCEDAQAFREEAHRRRAITIREQESTKSGDRVRVVGFDDLLQEDDYRGFPASLLSIPGHSISSLDGTDVSATFAAFVHAPFKDDSAGTRNNTSLALNIALGEGQAIAQALFFGDREYPTIKQIFEVTIENKRGKYLNWDVLLSAHHCSKKVMYWTDDGEETESFRKDIMAYLEKYKKTGGYVIASARSEFSDGEGDNPPHSKARKEYEKIVDAGHFICTHEHTSKEAPEPVVFELTEKGLSPRASIKGADSVGSRLGAAVSSARGGQAPPQQQVGFGDL
jgi:beta-lactamase superfamily II metal-dependent hydrolase